MRSQKTHVLVIQLLQIALHHQFARDTLKQSNVSMKKQLTANESNFAKYHQVSLSVKMNMIEVWLLRWRLHYTVLWVERF